VTWQGKGSTRRWRKIRAVVLERDNHVCQVRRPGCVGTADQVHHLYGVLGPVGTENPAHLVACCEPCNHAVGNPGAAGDPVDVVRRTAW
jgi:5-methylcytosine-specific restriction endonuclease McrA